MKAIRRVGLLSTVTVIASMAAMAGVAHAVTVACGTTITTNTTLTSDVGPCSSTAIIFGANNITLNLNGHKVFGIRGVPGEGPGIDITNHTGDHVINGTVSDFDAGIAITGGSANVVQAVTLTLNEGSSATNFGDGLAVDGSNNNIIQGNTVTKNAPFDGIGFFDGSSNNIIQGNVISDNAGFRTIGPHGTTEEDDGIRLENGSIANSVQGNTIERNGLDGIGVFFRATDNIIQGNQVNANGFHPTPPPPTLNRAGDGIHVFLQANRTRIEGNSVFNNARNGIIVEATSNTIVSNRTGGNLNFDLQDTNFNCDSNVWHANTFVTANPSCTTG